MKAFSEDIQDGLVRVLITVDTIECKVENDAPEFIDIEEDHPKLRIEVANDEESASGVFKNNYALKTDKLLNDSSACVFELEEGGIWFDIEMDKVKDFWIADYHFYVESEKPRYVSYCIQNLNHKLEWLEEDPESGKIRAISEFKKKFVPPKITASDSFKGDDILKCADMLGRAIRKIDIRTQGALVKFNTDEGRLESLIMGLADRMGYKIEVLDDEMKKEAEDRGINASHVIQLK